ncbi:MAG: hypothetical protein L6V93_11965 [Clostridiales bacterium]|nr:MAG: hypothetical protein L6V93_11965 [Clostridiales bacterium]
MEKSKRFGNHHPRRHSEKNIGGIVGSLSGTLKNCTFSGNIKAKTNVGGIAGYVTETGVIDSCTFSGSVIATSYTGGIAGQNFGTISNCENKGSINTKKTPRNRKPFRTLILTLQICAPPKILRRQPTRAVLQDTQKEKNFRLHKTAETLDTSLSATTRAVFADVRQDTLKTAQTTER